MQASTSHNLINIDSTESKILKLRQIDHDMKVLKASSDRIKKELINTHFANHDEFIDSDGLVMATYKSQTRNTFQSSDFKKDHLDVYEMYSKKSTIKVFSLKR